MCIYSSRLLFFHTTHTTGKAGTLMPFITSLRLGVSCQVFIYRGGGRHNGLVSANRLVKLTHEMKIECIA